MAEWQSKEGKSPTSNSQQWLCNFYLNAIFKPDANSFVFEPVIKEFSRSRAVWKRPLQKGYVLCSLNRLTSSRFAHASLNVSPSIPDSQGLLIVAGNHKIRILDRSKGLSYGILKSESPSWFIQKEINVRQEAARLGIPVPKLHSYANDKTWFKEEYVIGTPMNRLADYRQTEKLLHEAGKSLLMLINETLKEQLLSDYIEDLITKIGQNLQHNHLLSDKIKKKH
ncbi:MAG: hypothetical protein M5U34_10960 [Chloroflexi bacterium]|nr:hypothetical protein [Chloroflexota bacterium]